MKDSYLTLRIPADLARALSRWARSRGLAKSQVVREAVLSYLEPVSVEAVPLVTAGDLRIRWPSLPRLSVDEAADLGADIDAARSVLPKVRSAWD